MQTCQLEEGSILILAEFKNHDLECEYVFSDMPQSIWHLRYIMLLSAIISIAILFMDFYFIKDMLTLTVTVFISACYVATVFVIIRNIKIIKNINMYFILLSLYQYLFSCAFLYNIGLFRLTPDILTSDFLLLSAILFISLTPNRWIYSVIISIAISITFLSYFPSGILSLEAIKVVANIILIVCIITLIFSYRHKRNVSQRQHFIINKKLLILAATDPLTGISNRSKFDEVLGYWIEKANKYD